MGWTQNEPLHLEGHSEPDPELPTTSVAKRVQENNLEHIPNKSKEALILNPSTVRRNLLFPEDAAPNTHNLKHNPIIIILVRELNLGKHVHLIRNNSVGQASGW